jgi:hypothetical protein
MYVHINFANDGLGYMLGDYFSRTHLVTLLASMNH